MDDNAVEIAVSATKNDPKVIEVDAVEVARIIMRRVNVREKLALITANEIMDYLSECLCAGGGVERIPKKMS